MSALKKLDRMCLQNKRHKRFFDKDSYTLLCREDLWLFVQEKNQCFYKNTIDEQSFVFNDLTFSQVYLIKKSDRFDTRNDQIDRRKYVLCEIILTILKLYYKPFSPSFFIENKENPDSHTALEHIGKNWKNVKWILQADFQNCQAPFKNFTSLLQKRVQDSFFCRILISIFNTKQVNSSNSCFQIAMTRLLISKNIIYSYELDMLLFCIQHENKKIEFQFIPSVVEHSLKNVNKREKNVFKHFVTKIVYVRHAGNWMIGTNGPISLVKALFLQVYQFFKERLRLQFEVNRAKVMNLSTNSVSFVGYKILTKKNFDLQFELPLERMLTSLSLEGFCDKSGQPMPKKEWASEQDWLIVFTFNNIISQIRYYWGPALNQDILQRIKHTLYISCAKTLAHKHRTTASQIFIKYGKDLAINHPFHSDPQVKINLEKIERASWVQPRRYSSRYDSFSNIVFLSKTK
uniref:putative maturase n=1 Tax=Klebsormidium elegans TaxID=424407 RepID=UPI00286BD4DA|nr:putative maturase [Klebsormidium elegans]YP_010932827.1 putative maturase [Klebsormidium elegans]WKT06701.1 putative maturase [Klebsormidium elegans]WKT06702.1 putative maturase [Klebsormidium elegans]